MKRGERGWPWAYTRRLLVKQDRRDRRFVPYWEEKDIRRQHKKELAALGELFVSLVFSLIPVLSNVRFLQPSWKLRAANLANEVEHLRRRRKR
jgi:hypothetical protein